MTLRRRGRAPLWRQASAGCCRHSPCESWSVVSAQVSQNTLSAWWLKTVGAMGLRAGGAGRGTVDGCRHSVYFRHINSLLTETMTWYLKLHKSVKVIVMCHADALQGGRCISAACSSVCFVSFTSKYDSFKSKTVFIYGLVRLVLIPENMIHQRVDLVITRVAFWLFLCE